MSATRRKKKDVDADNYPTETWAVDRFLEEWKDLLNVGPRWLEPAVGDGVLIDRVNNARSGIEWTACDIRDTSPALAKVGLAPGDIHIGNFFELPEFQVDGNIRYDVVMMNPPFYLTVDFVARCLRIAKVVIMFQSLNFSGSQDRNKWIRANTPDVYTLPDRTCHTGDGKSDSVYPAWHVWGPHPPVQVGEYRVLDHTPLAVRRRARARIVQARDEVALVLDSLFSVEGVV